MRLIPNIGAEEGPSWRSHRHLPAVATTTRLWESLIEPESRGPDSQQTVLAGPRQASLDAWIGDPTNSVAWLNTIEAVEIAKREGHSLAGASPTVVERVHDKAFAHEVARRHSLLPRELEELIVPLDGPLLADPDRAVGHIQAQLSQWPEWAQRRFTLKPRQGSSGRGRVAGADGRVDTPTLLGALPRLAQCGGAMLEPWLDRKRDLSTQLHIQPGGEIVLLGTLEQRLSPAGVYLGHAGFIDARGRIHAGPPHDESIREPAALAGRAAAEAGYVGPCGVDAFSYRNAEGSEILREICEFNARFTLGWVVIGLLKRFLPTLREGIGILAEERRAFVFRLDEPDGGWPSTRDRSDLQFIPLWDKGDDRRPGLLVGLDRNAIDSALG